MSIWAKRKSKHPVCFDNPKNLIHLERLYYANMKLKHINDMNISKPVKNSSNRLILASNEGKND